MRTIKKILRFTIIVEIALLIMLTSTIDVVSVPTSQVPSKTTEFKPYKFIVFGDTRRGDDNSGLELCANLIEDLMQEHKIDFILHTGDIVDYGAVQEEYDTYYWPLMTTINETVQIYYAVGNHEYSTPGVFDPDLTTYLANVNNPGNEIYYSFNSPQNDTHFIVLNTDYYFNNNDPIRQTKQQEWLEADITMNSIERIVVMFHRPFWGANPSRVRYEYEVLRPIWHDFFVENGVDLVFNGHDHYFYHTVRNGTHYTVTGGGTQALFSPNPDHPEIQKTWQEEDFAFMDNHICLVEVNETSFNIDVIVTNGTTVYEYSVSALTDIYPPTINSPDDLVMIEDTTGNTISWTANDAHPGNFSIYQNGEVVDEDSWTNGTPIIYSLDELKEGDYNLTIILSDEIGHITNDTVIVRVNPNTVTFSTTYQSTSSETSIPTTNKSPLNLLSMLSALFYVYLHWRKKFKKTA